MCRYVCFTCFFFFFFQAEDGIRDVAVTGVQTCALPIWGRGRHGVVDRHGGAAALGERAEGAGEVLAGHRGRAGALGRGDRAAGEAAGPRVAERDARGVRGPRGVRDRDGVGAGNAITGDDRGDAVGLGDRQVSAGDDGVGIAGGIVRWVGGPHRARGGARVGLRSGRGRGRHGVAGGDDGAAARRDRAQRAAEVLTRGRRTSALRRGRRAPREAPRPRVAERDARGVGGPRVRDRDGVGAGNAITGGDRGDAVGLGDRQVSAGGDGGGIAGGIGRRVWGSYRAPDGGGVGLLGGG